MNSVLYLILYFVNGLKKFREALMFAGRLVRVTRAGEQSRDEVIAWFFSGGRSRNADCPNVGCYVGSCVRDIPCHVLVRDVLFLRSRVQRVLFPRAVPRDRPTEAFTFLLIRLPGLPVPRPIASSVSFEVP